MNDRTVDNFNVVKYANDTTFYNTVRDPTVDSVAPAIVQTQLWSENNSMTLNTEKTVIINISLNRRAKSEVPLTVNTLNISPSNAIKFLGIYIDSHLSFSTNVDSIVSKTNSRLFLLRQLKIVGMDKHGLHTFYCTNIRPVLAYAAPVWYFLLSKVDQERLERVQRHATRIILPLSGFIYDISKNLFYKIVNNSKHPLHDRIKVNTNRTSSRKPTVFYPARAKTTKRDNSFFPYFMAQKS